MAAGRRRDGWKVAAMALTSIDLVRALAAAGLDAGAGPDQVEAVPLPGEVAAAVATAAARLGGGPLAVRSSGVDEDLPGASYAGPYESVLGVPAGTWRPPCAAVGPRRSPATSPPTGNPAGSGGMWRWQCWCSRWWRPRRPGSPSAPTRSPATGTPRW